MVSFWPFRGDDTSATGFEKVLSSLTARINKASAKSARLRSQQRRYRTLWTIYTGLAYILALTILILVPGISEWSALEWFAVVASPFVIVAVRIAISSLYNYRISGTEAYLQGLQKQRHDTIEKLKAATKYNSTQQLLERYGGAPPSPAPHETPETPKKGAAKNKPPAERTGIAPPPTANIPSRNIPSRNNTLPQAHDPGEPLPGEEFAPNAFDHDAPRDVQRSPTLMQSPNLQALPPSQSPAAPQAQTFAAVTPPNSSRWYDAIMEAVLGEDETQPRNRMALICANPACRLVNGQAPPGTRSVEDVGRWRCMACQGWNGVESRADRIVRGAKAVGLAGPDGIEHNHQRIPGEGAETITDHPRNSDEDAGGSNFAAMVNTEETTGSTARSHEDGGMVKQRKKGAPK